MGASIVPFAFITVWELTKSKMSAFFSATFILCGMLSVSYCDDNMKYLYITQ